MSGSLTSLSSPLTMALLGGSTPGLLPAMQHLNLAQAMLSQGTSSAPARPMQGLARIAQALYGAYGQQQADKEIQGLVGQGGDGGAAAANDFIMNGAPSTNAAPAASASPAPSSSAAPSSSYVGKIASLESGGNASATNPLFPPERGGPVGAEQFTAGTWGDFAKANPDLFPNMTQDQILAARTDPALSAKATQWLAGVNAPILTSAGIPASPQNLAIAHALGGKGAAGVLSLPDNTPLSQAFAQTQPGAASTILAENPTYGTMTVGDLKAKYAGIGAPDHGTQYAQAGNVMTDAAPGGPQAQPSQGAAPSAPPTGMQSPDVQHLVGVMQRARQVMNQFPFPYDPRHLQAQTALENAQQQLQIGVWKTMPNGTMINSVTGEQKAAAAPLSHYVQDPNHPGTYIDTSGVNAPKSVPPVSHYVPDPDHPGMYIDTSGVNAPKSVPPPSHYVQDPAHPGTYIDTSGVNGPKFAPSPRVFQTPSGAGGAVGSGGEVTPLYPADNPGVAARAAASAAGAGTGTQSVKTADKMFDLGREADTALGNIDYGINQLHQAAQGGINSGYFAPWLATAAAAGKSLGVNLQALGVDPSAVGNVQSAQKTLGVVAGSILQNTIGKDSQITDAKIEHFIHTQPGIETDPQAIDRILNWARSQFVYNRNMAMDAMKNTDPNTGMLPPGWRAQYVAKNGAFAPIYDPLGGEMKQPAGESPPAEAPKPQASAPAPAQAAPAQPSRSDIEAEMRRRGLIK